MNGLSKPILWPVFVQNISSTYLDFKQTFLFGFTIPLTFDIKRSQVIQSNYGALVSETTVECSDKEGLFQITRCFPITSRKYCTVFTCLYKTVEQLAINPAFITSIVKLFTFLLANILEK
uniref:Uncharacterized protein n=1 Tax=Glossina pallidipes TaxID=7398 RepID=A0A1B0AFQ6_GLOPL